MEKKENVNKKGYTNTIYGVYNLYRNLILLYCRCEGRRWNSLSFISRVKTTTTPTTIHPPTHPHTFYSFTNKRNIILYVMFLILYMWIKYYKDILFCV